METRTHVHEETFAADADTLFGLLIQPSAIRRWWSAARAIVMPEAGGIWIAAWGEAEDAPDYITAAIIRECSPPHRLVLSDYRYRAKSGPLPFDADFVTEFVVEPRTDGALLRVSQTGFPTGREGDEFYEACRRGWTETFGGIRRYLDA